MLIRFDLTLPSSVRTLIIIKASTSSLSEQLLLFDCGTEIRNDYSLFLLKQVMSVWVIPIASVLGLSIFWISVSIYKSWKSKQKAVISIYSLDEYISSLM